MPRFTVLKILGATNGVTSKRTAVQTLGNQEESQCIYIYIKKKFKDPLKGFFRKSLVVNVRCKTLCVHVSLTLEPLEKQFFLAE